MLSVDAQFFGSERIIIGDNVRIDAFCVVSAGPGGEVRLGSHIHIASGARLFGGGGLRLGDFSSVSAGSTVYSESDDYSGESLMGPHIAAQFTNVRGTPIVIADYAAVGAHSLLLPGAGLGEGAVLGAMSMASSELSPWTIYAGIPARSIKSRTRTLLAKADAFRSMFAREAS